MSQLKSAVLLPGDLTDEPQSSVLQELHNLIPFDIHRGPAFYGTGQFELFDHQGEFVPFGRDGHTGTPAMAALIEI